MTLRTVMIAGACSVLVMLTLLYVSSELTGAVVTSASLVKQCEDTTGIFSSVIGTAAGDSVFVKSSVRTRIKGKVTARWKSNWTDIGTDSCQGVNLKEWSCSSAKSGARGISSIVFCQNGCTDGKCLLPPCSDPDPGAFEYSTSSTTTGLLLTDENALGVPPLTQQAAQYTDYCGSQEGLYEYSCSAPLGNSSNRFVRKTFKSCKTIGIGYKCIEGKCILPSK